MDIKEKFGSFVFNENVMAQRLPANTYKALKKTIHEGKPLDLSVANIVATAMKDWAVEKGATHYTHWFQPMTGVTAEKHDSFITYKNDCEAIMDFSGKELIMGESDASSFPSGGLRATFEARGYTAWDPTSYAFIKDNTLFIPTAFCSYGGHALDKKTPLLRSMEAINKEGVRLLHAIGMTDVNQVYTTVGAEQEYFLIDRDLWKKRKDLIFTGRTLFGSHPPKGQELEDHYFGSIKPRVAAFMRDLDEELWKLGVPAKTEHNEVAPAQHELAPIFTKTNTACDHNQLMMDAMKKVAIRHNLACLLHEKPFNGVNGSGKHNNWSVSTDTGINLLSPGKLPHENIQFLLFLSAVIKAVDDYQDLLRISVSSSSNDLRLGGNEAPPAIISMYVGDEILAILESIGNGSSYEKASATKMNTGSAVLPAIPKDTSDRNRTAPMAFTGNKFEFRMPGSAISVSGPNVVLNTIVAESLRIFSDRLEKAADPEEEAHTIIRDTYNEHKRILFAGNNYSDEWVNEAARRGLVNYKTTADAVPHFTDKKNVELFTKHRIFTEEEMHSRVEILLDAYRKNINIEALTMLDIAQKEIIPAAFEYSSICSKSALNKVALGLSAEPEKGVVDKIGELTSCLIEDCKILKENVQTLQRIEDAKTASVYCKEHILTVMEELRSAADALETLVGKKYWPFPTYGELLFSV